MAATPRDPERPAYALDDAGVVPRGRDLLGWLKRAVGRREPGAPFGWVRMALFAALAALARYGLEHSRPLDVVAVVAFVLYLAYGLWTLVAAFRDKPRPQWPWLANQAAGAFVVVALLAIIVVFP